MTSRRSAADQESSRTRWFIRSLVFAIVVAACILALSMVYVRWQSSRLVEIELTGNPVQGLNPVELLFLRVYLTSNADKLGEPIDIGSQSVTFVISAGESAEQIAANLAEEGIIEDERLLIAYLRYNGLDSQLEAGTFQIQPSLTIPELANSLTKAFAQEKELRFLEGWRLEEMAEYLADVEAGQIDSAEFLAIARRRLPLDLSAYDYLSSLPMSATLEGFLFPDTYRVSNETNAGKLIDSMLENMDRQLTPAIRQKIGAHGLTIYEAVTLASIVEREGVLDEERPLIASVFLNRLDQNMRLEADPTVQYALASSRLNGGWWKSPLDQADLNFDSPYNTYQVTGLPPGPIANPGLASLMAVAEPASSEYFFFVADCTTPENGDHAFSISFDEHLSKVQRCR